MPGGLALVSGLVFFVRTFRSSRRATRGNATSQKVSHPLARDELKRLFVFIALAALFGGVIFNGVSISLPKLLDERLTAQTGNLSAIGA